MLLNFLEKKVHSVNPFFPIQALTMKRKQIGSVRMAILTVTLETPCLWHWQQRYSSLLLFSPATATLQSCMSLPAFVVHTRIGLGHYDAATPCHKPSQEQNTFIRCSCGVNKKDSVNLMLCTCMTRCKCYKHSTPCTSLCRCVNFSNLSGARILHSKGTRITTKRKKHFQVDLLQSKQFAQEGRGDYCWGYLVWVWDSRSLWSVPEGKKCGCCCKAT